MPLRSALSDNNAGEQVFAFLLAVSGSAFAPMAELRMYSGDWTRVDWARHVYNILYRGGPSGLPGAHGRCFWVQKALSNLPMQVSHTCDVCGRMLSGSGRMQQCGGCRFARYCSGRCLSAGWYNGHREECAELRDAFPRDVDRLHLSNAYGYLSRYDFELWLHLMHEG